MRRFHWASTLLFVAFMWTGCQRSPEVFQVAAGEPFTLELQVPKGFKLNLEAPNQIRLYPQGSAAGDRSHQTWSSADLIEQQVKIAPLPASPQDWLLEGKLFVCEKSDAKICGTQKILQRLQVKTGLSKTPPLTWKLEAPAIPSQK